jgi:ureidoacrylate peracid hydrolase
MHKITIPQSVIDDVVRCRGREHVFDTLDPARTALIVVDMQNGFMMKGVAHALCEEAIEIVPNVNRLADAVRRTDGQVVWIQTAATQETLESWSVNVEMNGPERTAHRLASLGPGTKGYELWAGLDVKLNDLKIQKTRFSAFIHGSSNLEAVLRARGIDTVIITGTVTNAPQCVARGVLSQVRRHHAD